MRDSINHARMEFDNGEVRQDAQARGMQVVLVCGNCVALSKESLSSLVVARGSDWGLIGGPNASSQSLRNCP